MDDKLLNYFVNPVPKQVSQREIIDAATELVSIASHIYKVAIMQGLPETLAAEMVMEIILSPFKGGVPHE